MTGHNITIAQNSTKIKIFLQASFMGSLVRTVAKCENSTPSFLEFHVITRKICKRNACYLGVEQDPKALAQLVSRNFQEDLVWNS